MRLCNSLHPPQQFVWSRGHGPFQSGTLTPSQQCYIRGDIMEPVRGKLLATSQWMLQTVNSSSPGPWFNIKMSSYQYRKFHCGDKTVVRSSYLHNGIFYIGKMASLYWFSPLDKMAVISQTIFSDAFSWMKIFVFWLKFHWSLFLRVQLPINQQWFR